VLASSSIQVTSRDHEFANPHAFYGALNNHHSAWWYPEHPKLALRSRSKALRGAGVFEQPFDIVI